MNSWPAPASASAVANLDLAAWKVVGVSPGENFFWKFLKSFCRVLLDTGLMLVISVSVTFVGNSLVPPVVW